MSVSVFAACAYYYADYRVDDNLLSETVKSLGASDRYLFGLYIIYFYFYISWLCGGALFLFVCFLCECCVCSDRP